MTASSQTGEGQQALRDAAKALLAEWDRDPREQFVTREDFPEGFWSPNARMLKSEFINRLRLALAEATP